MRHVGVNLRQEPEAGEARAATSQVDPHHSSRLTGSVRTVFKAAKVALI